MRLSSPHPGKRLSLGRVALYLICGLVLAFLIGSWITGKRFQAAVEELHRRGEPIHVSELAPTVPPDQPNAADVYEQAFRIAPPSSPPTVSSSPDFYDLATARRQWTPQQFADAKYLVTSYAPYITLLEQASHVPACAFPVNWDGGFAMEVPHISKLRDARDALVVKAQVQLRSGELEQAAGTYCTLLRTAKHTRQASTIYNYLTALSLHRSALIELSQVLSQEDLSPAMCRTLETQLAQWDWHAEYIRMLKAERANDLAAFAAIDQGFLLHGFDGTDIGIHWTQKVFPFAARPWYHASKLHYLRIRARQLEAAGKSWEDGYRQLEAIDKEIDQQKVTFNGLIHGLVLSSIYGAKYWSAARTAAEGGAARIALVLTVYHHDHGKYPASLTELTRAGGNLPQDPFTQQPYHFRREGKGFILWSVGPDGIDNGATDYDPKKFDPPQPGYDFVFRVTR